MTAPNNLYPPGPQMHPVLGLRRFAKERLNFVMACRDQYDDIAYMHLFNRHLYLLFNAEDIHTVLVKQAGKPIKPPNQVKTLGSLLGDGLLTNNGDDWRQQRKLAQPAFHMQRIGGYGDVMVDYTLNMVQRWQQQPEVEAHSEMMHLTMEIVAKTLFDADVTNDTDDISHAVSTAIEAASNMIARPLKQALRWMPTPENLRAKDATQQLDCVVYQFIEDRRALGEDKGDLLSMLMLAEYDDGTRMSDKQLRDEVITLFLAGHETTANALTWALYLLAEHPDEYAKAVAAVDAALGNRRATIGDLPQLEALKRVIQEAMRLYPPAWIISRATTEPITLQGYAIEPGAILIMSQYAMHRHPRYWDAPDAFQPDRFLTQPDSVKAGYFPFGGGPRVCIGNSFAMMEMTLVLATLLQHVRFELAPGQNVDLDTAITLRPKDGLRLTLHQRDPAYDSSSVAT